MKLTKKIFDRIPHGETFATGFVENSPEGVYMTDTNRGGLLRWVAKKGFGNDWALYLSWESRSIEWIERSGDKLHNQGYIQKLVLCDPDVLELYRY